MQYEITFIVKDEAKQKLVKEIFSQSKAKILFENPMGRRNFTYPIKKEIGGFYFNYYLETEPTQIAEINKNLQAEREIIRFLIIKNDEDVKSIKERLERMKAKPKQFKKEIFKPEFELKDTKKSVADEDKEKIAKKIVTEKKQNEKPEVTVEKKKIKTVKEIKEEKPKTKKPAEKTKIKKEKPVTSEKIEKKTEKSIKSEDEKERIKKLEEKLDELLKD